MLKTFHSGPDHSYSCGILQLAKMAMPTMFTQGNQPTEFCEICGQPVGALDQKVRLQKQIFHKECFKCAICDQQLQPGSCAVDHVLYRFFGPLWFCSTHMMLGSGEKHDLLKKKMQRPTK